MSLCQGCEDPEGLDPGIAQVVESFNNAGIQTAESCEGGKGHSYEKPTVVLTGATADGWRAFAVCLDLGFPVQSLARVWDIENDEPRGPWWHVTFSSTVEAFGEPIVEKIKEERHERPRTES